MVIIIDYYYCGIQEKAVARKSPARSRSRPKSSSPKEKHPPARSRRSRTQVNYEEEEAEQEEEDEEEEEENKQEEEEGKEQEEEENKQEEEEGNESDKMEAEAAADEGQVGAGAEPVDEGKSGGDVKPVDEEMVADSDGSDAAAPTAEANLQTQPTTASEADNSLCHMEVSPHVDRKRKFDEIDDESDDDDDDAEEGETVKMLKVCEDSDEQTATVETPVDGEMTSADEPDMTAAESKLSLPLSSETNVEDDYVVITPDDVPPVDSDEVMNTAAKMVPSLSSAVSNDTLDAVDIPNPILCREYVANPAAGPADTSRCFTLGSYNILASYHAQRDYSSGSMSWLTAEQLSLSSRHQRLIEELVYLDEDVICLQEVGGDYMEDMLQPKLER